METSFLGFSTRLVVAVSAISLGAGLASCSPAEPAVPISTDARSALLSLSTMPSDLTVAHNLARRSCMQTAGFEVPYDSTVGGRPRAALIGIDGLFASEKDARSYGYNTTVSAEGIEDTYRNSLSAERQAAYDEASFGDPEKFESIMLSNGAESSRGTEGCVAEADRAVYGSVRNALDVMEFINEANAQTAQFYDDAESAVRSGMDDYESCMAEAGVTVDGLNASSIAEERFGAYRSSSETPNAEEQALAVTDYTCQQEAKFADSLNTVFIDKAGAWIVQNEEYILSVREKMDSAMQNTVRITSGG